ncbi:hypothetical protein OsJ_12292 [Oryza sativa Japonica Group]|uniref:peptidylprolyl isomerase n=2 Tax=Oryza sativa subsp. japonica TaxID=39947 RepID=A3ALX9_ORYSJ|nr:hypothetical protein OsJ_12292 [Oryza sativa Japonica Group]
MATFLGSSPAFLARPVAAKPHLSCAQSPRPPSAQPPPEQQPPTPTPTQQQSMQAQPQARPEARAGGGGVRRGLDGLGGDVADAALPPLNSAFNLHSSPWLPLPPRDVEQEQEVVLPNGIRYYEMRVGGGDVPRPGDLVVIDLKGRVTGGEAFVDTFGDGKRPLALVMGSRPYTRGMCEGVEYVLRSMRAGGKRRVVVPPALGFGDDGADFGDAAAQVPPGATLEYVVEVDKVSIAPA